MNSSLIKIFFMKNFSKNKIKTVLNANSNILMKLESSWLISAAKFTPIKNVCIFTMKKVKKTFCHT